MSSVPALEEAGVSASLDEVDQHSDHQVDETTQESIGVVKYETSSGWNVLSLGVVVNDILQRAKVFIGKCINAGLTRTQQELFAFTIRV